MQQAGALAQLTIISGRRRPLTLLALLMAWAACCAAQAQKKYIINSSRLTTEDGLVSNTTLCGLQDSRGFIWIGTTDGLQRYDGKAFRLFTKEKDGLRANKIAAMAEDKDGRLWLQYGSSAEALLRSGRMADLLDLRTCSRKTLAQAFGASLPFQPDDLKWFFADEQRNLFLITGDNALWWYRGGGSFKLLLKNGHTGHRFFPHGSLYQAYGGSIWMSSDSDLVHVDTLGRVTRVKQVQAAKANNVFHIAPDGSCIGITGAKRENHGRLVHDTPPLAFKAATTGAVSLLPFQFFTPVGMRIRGEFLIEYRADIRTRSVMMHNPHIGLQLFTDSGAIMLIDAATLATEAPLSPYAYFTDRGGGHWLCTSLGIFRFRISPAWFSSYLTRVQMPAVTAVAMQGRGILDDGCGSVYFGRDALYKLDKKTGRTAQLADQPVYAVQADNRQSIWYSTATEIHRISRNGDDWKIGSGLDKEQETWCLYTSRNGRQYVGGERHIGYIRGDSLIALRPCSGKALAHSCYQFFEDRRGRLWAVTDDGLFAIKDDCYIQDENGQMKLPGVKLYYVYEDRDGAWWLCTGGDGLIYWNREKGITRRYGTAEGLPAMVLYALLPDSRGLFWISSSRGLIQFNPGTGAIKTFTKKDGLPDNEFNRISYHKAPDGRMYFGGLNGFTAFYPDAIPAGDNTMTFRVPLQLISVQYYSAAAKKMVDMSDSLISRGTVTLEPGDNILTLNVALLDYGPGRHQYSYMLEGLDDTWRYSGEGLIRLENLPYGDYVLRIKGQAAEGAWSTEELHLRLSVHAPFYKKPLFITGAALLALILLLLGIRARVRILQRANRRLEQMVEQRTGELRKSLAEKDILMREIHHRVKNNLQVISALQQMQASRSPDPQVKAALEDSQNRVLSIAFIHHNLYQHDDMKGVEMASFVAELVKHVSDVFSKPELAVSVAQDVPLLYLDIDTAVPLGLIINELLTNAYKYAFAGREAGNVRIVIAPEAQNAYHLIFSDDGVGLPEGLDILRSKSLGFRLISQLSRQLGGAMQYEHSGGSLFRLRFSSYEARNMT